MRPFTGALFAALAACLPVCGLRADLAGTSPFLPKAAAGAEAAAGPAGPLELRGVMSSSLGASFCIYDVARKRDTWVGLNEAGHDFVVKSAEPGGESVLVDYQGRSLKLVFKSAKVSSSGGISPAAPAAGPPQGGGLPVVLNPSPADEQRRLDAVAQEVRRRRMERERASQGPDTGQQPPVPNR